MFAIRRVPTKTPASLFHTNVHGTRRMGVMACMDVLMPVLSVTTPLGTVVGCVGTAYYYQSSETGFSDKMLAATHGFFAGFTPGLFAGLLSPIVLPVVIPVVAVGYVKDKISEKKK